MNDYWKQAIPQLDDESLMDIAIDAYERIQSHSAGGNPTAEYVEQQRYLIGLVEEELGRRLKDCEHKNTETIPVPGCYETYTICRECGQEI